jgi:hypothetical protein
MMIVVVTREREGEDYDTNTSRNALEEEEESRDYDTEPPEPMRGRGEGEWLGDPTRGEAIATRGDRGEVRSDRQLERLVDAAIRFSCTSLVRHTVMRACDSAHMRVVRYLEAVGFEACGGWRGQLEELHLDALHHLVQLGRLLAVGVVQRLKVPSPSSSSSSSPSTHPSSSS